MPRHCVPNHPRVVPANAGTHNHRRQLLKESRQPSRQDNNRRGVWVPARASLGRDDVEDTPPHSRGAFSPEALPNHPPQKVRGRRECRVLAAPAVSCARMRERSAHEHTGTVGAIRHSLRNGFTAYTVLSPATNSSCHRRRRIEAHAKPGWVRKTSGGLTPATGARTTRFCRPQKRRSSGAPASLTGKARPAKTFCAPGAAAATASRLTSVTIAIRPSCGTGCAKL